MNREIKVRGKRKDGINIEWHYGFLIIEPNNSYWIDYYTEGKRQTTQVLQQSVGQYTGLKDINKNEIYEGDILKRNNILYEVVWFDAAFALKTIDSEEIVFSPSGYFELSEIIGNMQYNKELFKLNK